MPTGYQVSSEDRCALKKKTPFIEKSINGGITLCSSLQLIRHIKIPFAGSIVIFYIAYYLKKSTGTRGKKFKKKLFLFKNVFRCAIYGNKNSFSKEVTTGKGKPKRVIS